MTAVRKMTDMERDSGASARAPVARPDARDQDSSGGSRANARERRDIVSGEVLPDSRLLRFVADPDGQVVPDAAAKLPGRGLWVEASKDAVNKAVEKKLFSRAAKTQVTATAHLAARAGKALVA